jgi:ABC-type transport system substrate-binding protein
VVGVVLLVVLAGGEEGSSSGGAANTGASATTDRTLVVAMPSTPESADPEFGATTQSWQLPINVYEFMTAYRFQPNDDGIGEPQFDEDLEPRLAESWTVSPDGREITFNPGASLRISPGRSTVRTSMPWQSLM